MHGLGRGAEPAPAVMARRQVAWGELLLLLGVIAQSGAAQG